MAADPKSPQERARRLARLIVGDLILYHREKIAEGIRNDTLFDLLEPELREARAYYEQRVEPAVRTETDYFNQAVVDILVKGRGDIESKIW